MKTNTKIALLAGGVVVSLTSLAPLTTHAVDSATNVQVNVGSTITIDAAGTNIETSSSNIKTGSISATVTSNSRYTISIKAADTGKTALANATSTANIPAVTGTDTATLTAGTSAWGLKRTLSATDGGTLGDDKAVNSTSDTTGYTGLTSADVVYYKTAAGETNKTVEFPVGIAVSSNLPSGEYSTSVTITAATY